MGRVLWGRTVGPVTIQAANSQLVGLRKGVGLLRVASLGPKPGQPWAQKVPRASCNPQVPHTTLSCGFVTPPAPRDTPGTSVPVAAFRGRLLPPGQHRCTDVRGDLVSLNLKPFPFPHCSPSPHPLIPPWGFNIYFSKCHGPNLLLT